MWQAYSAASANSPCANRCWNGSTRPFTGQFTPGTHLGEVELSEQLGVSRGTVREALRTLHQRGLVVEAERGLKVRRLSPKEITELFQVRASLEALALTLVMALPDKQQRLDALEDALPPQRNTHLSYLQCLDLDMGFHHTLLEIADNHILTEMWTTLESLIRVTVLADQQAYPRPIMTREHHAPIVEAMRGDDEAAALRTLREHMGAASAVLEQAAASA
jgi:DNA-binding GntR family transcriptional regulator